MKIFENSQGVVEKGFFTGFRFTHKNTGRKIPATPWMKHRMGELREELRQRGFDPISDDDAGAMFWSYFIDLAMAPPNGLRHQAEAQDPASVMADQIAAAIRQHRGRPPTEPPLRR